MIVIIFGIPELLEAGWTPRLGEPLIQRLSDDVRSLETYTWNVAWDQEDVAYFGRDHLWRWDGSVLEKIGKESFVALRGIEIDEDGLVWLAGINRFGVYDPSTGVYTSRLDWLPEKYRQFGEGWIVHHDGKSVWLGTDRMLFRMNGADVAVWEFGGEHRIIFHFLDSGIYAHETNIGLWRIEGEGKTLVNADSRLAEKSVLFLEDQSDGSMLALSNRGLFVLSEDLDVSKIQFSELLTDLQISSVGRISNEHLVVTTLGRGIHILDCESHCILPLAWGDSIGTELLINQKLDPLGNLVVCGKAVWIIRSSVSAGFTSFGSTKINGYQRSLSSTSSDVYFCSDSGVYDFKVFEENKISKTTIHELWPGEILNVECLDTRILFDRYDSLFVYETDTPQLLHEFGRVISAWTVGPDAVIYVAFPSQLEAYALDDAGQMRLLAATPVINNLQQLSTDAHGHVWGWAPHAPLIEYWQDGFGEQQMRYHVEADGVDLEDADFRLSVTDTGPVLIFQDKLMRWRADSGKWERSEIPEIGNLQGAYAFRSMAGNLEGWLVVWNHSDQFYRVVHVTWGDDGTVSMRDLPWPDMAQLGSITEILPVDYPGVALMIGGSEGILFAGEDLSDQIPPPIRPTIAGIESNLEMARESVYRFGDDSIRIRLGPRNPGGYYPLKFQTRLSDAEDWSESSTLLTREFGPLIEGDYRLEARTVDPFGRVSESAVFEFIILPPWYRSTLGYVFYVFLILLCIGFPVFLWTQYMQRSRKHLEKKVEKATAALRKANAGKDDFIANLSHEIRNPLNGIIGMIQQMKEGDVPPARYLKGLRGAASYLQDTVEEVLDLSKLQSGKLQREYSLFDITEIAEGATETYRYQAQEKRLEFISVIEVPEGTGIVSDARKIRQLIGNLVGNAVKFTDRGSVQLSLVLKIEKGSLGTLTITVTDTGSGIPQEYQKRIFDKFFKIREGVLGKSGTGIGLSLVKAYTELMDGEFYVNSRLGMGSTFTIEIPVETEKIQTGIRQAEAIKVLDLPLHILVVEDEEYNRIVMEDMLTEFGCQVESSATGKAAIEQSGKGIHDLVFLDLELPDMNGLEIARKMIGSGNLLPGARVVALTAHATPAVRERCLQAGFDAFLTKPVSREQVLRILQRHHADPGDSTPSDPEPDSHSLILSLGNLEELAQTKGWPATKAQFVDLLEGYLGELSGEMKSDDAERIRKSAHRFLGFLAMIQVRILPALLLEMQESAREGDLAMTREHWAEFQKHVGPFKEELNRRFPR